MPMSTLDLLNPLGFYSEIANLTGVGPALFKSQLNRDDIEAIKAYFEHTPAKTPEAQNIAVHFRDWYSKLSTTGGYTDTAFAQAKKFRDDYNLANAITHAEKQQVVNVQSTGLSREEAYGLEKDQKSLLDKLSTAAKWTGYGVAGAGVGYVALKLIKLIRFI